MKRYWDYTEKERAAFTREQVAEFLDYELMEVGVLKVPPLVLEEIKPEPPLKRTMWFSVGGTLFRTADQAQRFLALEPHDEDYNYSCGYDKKFAKPASREIRQVELFDMAEVANAATILSQNKAAKEANDKAREAHAKAVKEQENVLDHLIDNWERCVEKANKHQRVIDTRAQYIKLANGDREVAANFLLKVFSQAEIDAADAWFTGEPGPKLVAAANRFIHEADKEAKEADF